MFDSAEIARKINLFAMSLRYCHDNCKYAVMPPSNIDFWKDKLMRNKERDQQIQAELESAGWKVITVWECQLKKAQQEETLEKLYHQITSTIL